MDRDELKQTFHRVNAYRQVCAAVQRSANNTLFHGFIFAGVALLLYNVVGPTHWLFLAHLGLAILEFSVGFWKKLAPSVECVLVDALNSLAFGGSLVIRYILAWQGVIKLRPDNISLFIGCWILFGAWTQFKNYRILRRAFVERPSREQMNYVEEMIRDIRDGDPAEDPAALDLPTMPPIKALLADELAFIVDPGSGEVLVVDREQFTIRRQEPTPTRPAGGRLTLDGSVLPPFELSGSNWANYVRWKGPTQD